MTTMTVANDEEDADNPVHEPNAAAAVKFNPWVDSLSQKSEKASY